jgi:hypothetical protein
VKCFGCNRELEVGDHYIEDTPTGFLGREADEGDATVNSIISDLFSGRRDGKVVFCDDCTVEGGDYKFETYYGDEEDADE